MRNLSIGLALLGTLGGCGESLSPQAAMVRSATPPQVEGCQFLGPVSAFGAVIGGGISAADTKARNEVAARGGTHMVIVSTSVDQGAYPHGRIQAEAYRC